MLSTYLSVHPNEHRDVCPRVLPLLLQFHAGYFMTKSAHPQLAQVMLSLDGLNRAYGDPFFFPIFEVATV